MAGYVRLAVMHALMALSFMMWPPFLFLSAGALAMLYISGFTRPFKAGLWKPYHWLVLTHLLFFPAAISTGVLWSNHDRRMISPAEGRALIGLQVMFYASLASSGFWIWRMKGFRWFAAGLMMLLELAIAGAVFIAGMSVSGDWL